MRTLNQDLYDTIKKQLSVSITNEIGGVDISSHAGHIVCQRAYNKLTKDEQSKIDTDPLKGGANEVSRK